jgi:hypothetical protein
VVEVPRADEALLDSSKIYVRSGEIVVTLDA